MTAATSSLMTALRFTEADLDANRQGLLSVTQIASIKHSRRRNTLIAAALFVVLVVTATVFIYLGQLNNSLILKGVGALLIIVNAILVGIMGRSFMRVGSDLRAGQVDVLAGEVERIVRRGRQGDGYLLRINDIDLRVTRDVFLGFEHMTPYRVYRTGHSGVLLSAERIV